MFTTGQFRVFSGEPSDRALSRPRRLVQEGRMAEAEDAYGTVLATQPSLRAAWAEYFEVLRASRRFDEALALAERAGGQFGEDALPPALRGAALVELGRYREGLAALEEAAVRDPNLGIVWHEAGYAAYRLGEFSRALMALDRAFALEPHSGTLHLRGKILRQAGRYLAAEVAFEGAMEAAEFPEQRAEAGRQIGVTRRYAAYHGHRPDSLSPTRRWFAESGAVLLTSTAEGPAPTDDELLLGFAELVQAEEWRFTSLTRTDGWPGWARLAESLGVPMQDECESGAEAVPLVVGRRPHPGPGIWGRGARTVAELNRGLTFVLHQPIDLPSADIVGMLDDGRGAVRDLGSASEEVQHPESRLAKRRLK